MKVNAVRRRRQTAAVWGAMAAVSVAAVLMAWVRSPTAAEHALFGRAGSVLMAAIAVVVTVGAIVALAPSTRASRWVRWALALPVAVAAGGVGALAAAGLLAPADATDTGSGIVLTMGAAGMSILATQVARGNSGGSTATR